MKNFVKKSFLIGLLACFHFEAEGAADTRNSSISRYLGQYDIVDLSQEASSLPKTQNYRYVVFDPKDMRDFSFSGSVTQKINNSRTPYNITYKFDGKGIVKYNSRNKRREELGGIWYENTNGDEDIIITITPDNIHLLGERTAVVKLLTILHNLAADYITTNPEETDNNATKGTHKAMKKSIAQVPLLNNNIYASSLYPYQISQIVINYFCTLVLNNPNVNSKVREETEKIANRQIDNTLTNILEAVQNITNEKDALKYRPQLLATHSRLHNQHWISPELKEDIFWKCVEIYKAILAKTGDQRFEIPQSVINDCLQSNYSNILKWIATNILTVNGIAEVTERFLVVSNLFSVSQQVDHWFTHGHIIPESIVSEPTDLNVEQNEYHINRFKSYVILKNGETVYNSILYVAKLMFTPGAQIKMAANENGLLTLIKIDMQDPDCPFAEMKHPVRLPNGKLGYEDSEAMRVFVSTNNLRGYLATIYPGPTEYDARTHQRNKLAELANKQGFGPVPNQTTPFDFSTITEENNSNVERINIVQNKLKENPWFEYISLNDIGGGDLVSFETGPLITTVKKNTGEVTDIHGDIPKISEVNYPLQLNI